MVAKRLVPRQAAHALVFARDALEAGQHEVLPVRRAVLGQLVHHELLGGGGGGGKVGGQGGRVSMYTTRAHILICVKDGFQIERQIG